MAEKKEYLDMFHNYGVYLPTRTIEMSGPVDDTMYRLVIKNIHFLDSQTGLINIKLNSEGGDLIECRAIYDSIKSCKNKVRIIVYGQASSAASILLQAADERIMSPNSFLMVHVGHGQSADSDAHPENKKRWDAFDDEMGTWFEDIYLKKIKQVKPRYTKNQLKSILRFDTILSPKKALELGLIDKIGDPQ